MRLLALLAIVTGASAAPGYFPPPDSAGGWRVTKNAAETLRLAGMDVARLDQAFEYASRTSAHGGLLVARHGWLVYQRYSPETHLQAVDSAAMATWRYGFPILVTGRHGPSTLSSGSPASC